MKIILDTFKNTGDIHHAYLLEGEKAVIREKLLNFVEKSLKHPIQGNPDFWHQEFQNFSIDDARALKEMQLLKPVANPRKIFVIETMGMTVEAQNALLKIFEEPNAGTHFFLIVDSVDVFLPTLKSRMIIVRDTEQSEEGKSAVKKFLKASIAERLKIVEEIVEEKNKAQAAQLIDGLIVELGGKKEADKKVLEELLTMRSYLNDRSPSLKLILEHISLILPII